LYGQGLSNFVAFDAADFEMPLSYARHLSNSHGQFASLAPISSTFSSVRAKHSLMDFLSKSASTDLTLLMLPQ
jgi:hypothetical protein